MVEGSRVGIVGGSIAGCAAAVALERAGCEPVVFERSRGELRDRGGGILIPETFRDEAVRQGYIDPGYRPWIARERLWVLRDGSAPMGRVIWRQPSPSMSNNWGVFWSSLRSQVPDRCYREGASIDALEQTGSGWLVRMADGSCDEVDVLVGADGYRSRVRALLHPDSHPEYAGYVLWRGVVDEVDVPDRGAWDEGAGSGRWWTVCFPGGHGVFYAIPGFDGASSPGRRRVNWAIYCTPPTGTRFDEAVSVPPGSVDDGLVPSLEALLAEHFPSYLAALVQLSIDAGNLLIQPIYDERVSTYVGRNVLLVGDASTLARPHTGSGSVKAIQDAMALERICGEHRSWEEVLAAYDAERCAAGLALVELGRRIGRAQVEETPDWGAMTPETMERWTAAMLSGQTLYLYGASDPAISDADSTAEGV